MVALGIDKSHRCIVSSCLHICLATALKFGFLFQFLQMLSKNLIWATIFPSGTGTLTFHTHFITNCIIEIREVSGRLQSEEWRAEFGCSPCNVTAHTALGSVQVPCVLKVPVLMHCVPMFIFTTSSSFWAPLLAIFNTLFWVYANVLTRKQTKHENVCARHFHDTKMAPNSY